VLTLARLDALLAALPIASGRSVAVGVAFNAPLTLVPSANVTGVLGSTITIALAGGATLSSALSNATDVDQVPGALSIVKSVNTSSAQPAYAVTYRIDVTNRSASPASAVSFTDVPPRGFTLVAKSVAGGTTAVIATTWRGSTLTFDLDVRSQREWCCMSCTLQRSRRTRCAEPAATCRLRQGDAQRRDGARRRGDRNDRVQRRHARLVRHNFRPCVRRHQGATGAKSWGNRESRTPSSMTDRASKPKLSLPV
jgi:uncharacterized repeat protein (TIGR01451 family)